MPKVIFLDVDGTLVDYSNYLPASAVDAIRNGGEEAKAAADYVTDAVNEDGLYKAFEKLGLL